MLNMLRLFRVVPQTCSVYFGRLPVSSPVQGAEAARFVLRVFLDFFFAYQIELMAM